MNKDMTDRSIREIEEMGEGKYINPYTDFGFKKLFGTPLNKDLLISFLNSLFEGKEVVSDLTYLNGENLGNGYSSKTGVYSTLLSLYRIKGRKAFGISGSKVSIRLESWISSSPTTNTPRTVFGTK